MPVTLRQMLREVQSEAALVGADVEGAAGGVEAAGPFTGRDVVGALVEEGSGLLSCIGVVVKGKAIEPELRAGDGLFGIRRPERCERGRGEAFKLADARVRPLEDGGRFQRVMQDACAEAANGRRVEPASKKLQDDEVVVLVDDEAGQLIGFAEAEPAGVGVAGEERLAADDGGAEAGLKQFEPALPVERFAGDEAEGDLRRRAIERRANEQAAAVGHLEQRGRIVGCLILDGFNVRGVDPEVAGAKAVCSAAADAGARGALGLVAGRGRRGLVCRLPASSFLRVLSASSWSPYRDHRTWQRVAGRPAPNSSGWFMGIE